MMSAASTGDNQRLAHLLQLGMNVNIEAPDGYTALHCAAKAGHVHTIRYLLLNSANIEAANDQNKGRRPLHEAILGRQVIAATTLLQAGADIVTPGANGDSTIDYVGSTGDVGLAQALLRESRGQMPTDDIVSLFAKSAARKGNIPLLEWILSTFPSVLPYSTRLKHSLLYISVLNGHQDVLNLLLPAINLEKNFNIRLRETVSRCLPLAVAKRNVVIVKTLLPCKEINVNQTNSDGYTALHIAILNQHVEIAALILSHCKVDVNGLRKYRGPEWTPLYFAVYRGCTEIVRLLLDHPDIEADQKDYLGRNPLHIAASRGRIETVELLLNHSVVYSTSKDKHGSTPICLAFLGCHWKALELLAKHEGIDMTVNVNITGGQAPIGDEDQICRTAKILLDRGELSVGSNQAGLSSHIFFSSR
jgi:ankyrin repeat protein